MLTGATKVDGSEAIAAGMARTVADAPAGAIAAQNSSSLLQALFRGF